MSEHDEEVNQNLGISRRTLLRRGAVVGGTLMWTAPMVKSMTPAAFAQTAGPSPGEHACCYCYSIDDGPHGGATRRVPQVGDVIDVDQCNENGILTPGGDPDPHKYNRQECREYCGELGYQYYDYNSGPNDCTCYEFTDPRPAGERPGCVSC